MLPLARPLVKAGVRPALDARLRVCSGSQARSALPSPIKYQKSNIKYLRKYSGGMPALQSMLSLLFRWRASAGSARPCAAPDSPPMIRHAFSEFAHVHTDRAGCAFNRDSGKRSVAGASCSRPCPERPAPFRNANNAWRWRVWELPRRGGLRTARPMKSQCIERVPTGGTPCCP